MDIILTLPVGTATAERSCIVIEGPELSTVDFTEVFKEIVLNFKFALKIVMTF